MKKAHDSPRSAGYSTLYFEISSFDSQIGILNPNLNLLLVFYFVLLKNTKIKLKWVLYSQCMRKVVISTRDLIGR